MMLPTLRPLLLSLTLALTCLAGCAAAAKPENKLVTAPTDLNNLQPWCIGRFVINLPAGTTAYTQSYTYAGNKIETLDRANLGFFQRKVNQREQELKTKTRVNVTGNYKTGNVPTNTPWLEQAVSTIPNARSFFFNEFAGRLPNISYFVFEAESYVLVDSSMVKIQQLAPASLTDSQANQAAMVTRVKYRDNWAVPTEAGFCFDGGLMTGPQKYAEFVDQSFGLDAKTDAISLVMHMRPSVPNDLKDTLLDRVPAIEQNLNRLGLKQNMRILRKTNRPLAGMDGQELLMRLDRDGAFGFDFTWESQGKPGALIQPQTTIEMQFGRNSTSSPLSEEEALKFWDALMNSFKLRPGAV